MTDPILKKAIAKRDEALREVERWEAWIKNYTELAEPSLDELDIPGAQHASPPLLAAVPAFPAATSNGKGIWPRGGSTEAGQ
jgi:hypothetical protein